MRGGGVVYRYDSGGGFSIEALAIRFVINLAGLFLAETLVPGIVIGDTQSLVFATLIFALVNMLLRPIATLFAFCLIMLTFGLFVLIINTALLALTAWIAGVVGLDFTIDGFWSAFFGALIISIVSVIASTLVRGRR